MKKNQAQLSPYPVRTYSPTGPATHRQKQAILVNNAPLVPPLLPQTIQNYTGAQMPNQQINVGQRGRPQGSAAPAQTGVQGQPSAAASVAPSAPTRGFGNDATSGPSSKGHQSTTPTAKSAGFSSAELKTKKAYIWPGAGAGLGALSAPAGHAGEGALRGLGRAGGIGAGASLGMGTGYYGGMGLGAGLGGLAGSLGASSPAGVQDAIGAGAGLGGALGGLAGAGYGGVKGYQAAGDYMGPASYDKDNKHKEKKHKEEKKEKKGSLDMYAESSAYISKKNMSREKSAFPEMLYGAGLEGAKALSRRLPPEEVKSRSIRGLGHGLMGSVGLTAGGGIGGALGALAGGLGGAGLGAISGNPGLVATGTVTGAGLGGAAGLYHGGKLGGRLGYNLFRHGKDEDNATDMAKDDARKAKRT